MKFKQSYLSEQDEDVPAADAPPATEDAGIDDDPGVTAARNDLVASLAAGDEPAPDAEAGAAADSVTSDANKQDAKPQNPVNDKPYSERITYLLKFLKEFGYSQYDFQHQQGKESSISVVGKMDDEDIKALKKFSNDIRINANISSSKVDDDNFITNITITNRISLQSFKDLMNINPQAAGEEAPPSTETTPPEETPPTETETEAGAGTPEALPTETPSAAPEETPPPEEAGATAPAAEETPPPIT